MVGVVVSVVDTVVVVVGVIEAVTVTEGDTEGEDLHTAPEATQV